MLIVDSSWYRCYIHTRAEHKHELVALTPIPNTLPRPQWMFRLPHTFPDCPPLHSSSFAPDSTTLLNSFIRHQVNPKFVDSSALHRFALARASALLVFLAKASSSFVPCSPSSLSEKQVTSSVLSPVMATVCISSQRLAWQWMYVRNTPTHHMYRSGTF